MTHGVEWLQRTNETNVKAIINYFEPAQYLTTQMQTDRRTDRDTSTKNQTKMCRQPITCYSNTSVIINNCPISSHAAGQITWKHCKQRKQCINTENNNIVKTCTTFMIYWHLWHTMAVEHLRFYIFYPCQRILMLTERLALWPLASVFFCQSLGTTDTVPAAD